MTTGREVKKMPWEDLPWQDILHGLHIAGRAYTTLDDWLGAKKGQTEDFATKKSGKNPVDSLGKARLVIDDYAVLCRQKYLDNIDPKLEPNMKKLTEAQSAKQILRGGS